MMTPEEEFWDRVDTSGGHAACWPWRLAKNESGYGVTRWGKKQVLSHRKGFV